MNPTSKNSPKSLLRNKLRKRILAVSATERRKKSQSVCQGLWRSDFVQEARRILIYAAHKDELDTLPLIRQLLKAKKKVYLPRIENDRVFLYRITNLKTDLGLGAYGIREPKKVKARWGNIREIDLAIVPGLGFTRDGVRLGRGGGHFDRLLAKAGHIVKIGVGFREQILKSIPVLRHDVRMNFVVTD
jgi:5-formyltetrahydrofolate cyclo-ligase